jgi:hypothetical protein
VHLDRISEAIAHFIGLFQITAEQARLRDDYLEFKALQAALDQTPPDDHAQITFQTPYDFDDPDPGLRYVPAGPAIVTLAALSDVNYVPMAVPVNAEMQPVIYPGYLAPHFFHFAYSGSPLFELQPPGSVAVQIAQVNNLSDNDFVNIGARGVDFHPIGIPDLTLDTLLHDALHFLPIEPPSFGSAADIGSFVTDTAASLNAFAEAAGAASENSTPDDSRSDPASTAEADGVTVDVHVSVAADPLAGETYVNGQIVSEAPKLDDKLPAASPLAPDPAVISDGGNAATDNFGSVAVGGTIHGQGTLSGAASVDLGTGGNALVNSATVINDTLEGGVFAVAGNHFSLDAIIQINAWSDSDSIGASLNGWNGASGQISTSAFNIAQMERIDAGNGSNSDAHAPTGFPQAWVVTEITGDFVSLNWIQQLNFITDNDTSVVSSSYGVTTQVGMGENQSFNHLSVADLGRNYDLVLIGGNYYDANIISQTNVLLDDDIAGAVAGFHSSGQGSVSTGDNLLWNNANITSIGQGETGAMPNGFLHAIHDFQDGDKTLSSDVLNDSAFLGLPGLRVLYISGSIYDLQYVQQTNVLGDADQIALAMNSLHPANDGNWTITTGSNALVNSAQIVDVDPTSKIYVGGDHYSDELLVQTDIIRTDHLAQIQDADHLVNEAVAFLSDDMANPDHQDPVSHLKSPLDVHPGHSDIMQSIIS